MGMGVEQIVDLYLAFLYDFLLYIEEGGGLLGRCEITVGLVIEPRYDGITGPTTSHPDMVLQLCIAVEFSLSKKMKEE